jgi:hypothetical protein
MPGTQSQQESFTFSIGNEYHPSGWGAWKMELDNQGRMRAIWHHLGSETRFGPFQLEHEEYLPVWNLIHRMDLTRISSSERMGIPDEVMYTFTLLGDNTQHQVWMWQGDILNFPAVRAIVAEMNLLIQKYTGQSLIG